MSNQYFNFYYDPVRQGYDSDTWSTVLGVPVINTNRLKLVNAATLHKNDILRGEAVFNVNMSAPAAGADIKIGFSAYSADSFIGFIIADDIIRAEVNYQALTDSFQPLTWDSAWDNANIDFKIKWEAGKADFYINNEFKWSVSDINVTNTPMNLYIKNNTAAAVPMYVNYIEAKDIQNLM